MAIITNTEQLQKYLNVTGTVQYTSILPFANDAQSKYMREFLGDTLLGELENYINNVTLPSWSYVSEAEVNAALDALIPYACNALAKFTMYLASPSLDIKITEGGFAIVQNTNLAPASTDRVKRFTDSMLQSAYDAVETMLRFLEANHNNYPTWVSSDAYTLSIRYFINSAEEFDKHVNINASRLTFRNWRQDMENIEILNIEPVISTELADAIRAEIASDEVSVANDLLLKPIRKAVANYTAAITMGDKYKLLGDHYLGEVRRILNANPTTYPLWAASESYDSTLTNYAPFENTLEATTFVFGQ